MVLKKSLCFGQVQNGCHSCILFCFLLQPFVELFEIFDVASIRVILRFTVVCKTDYDEVDACNAAIPRIVISRVGIPFFKVFHLLDLQIRVIVSIELIANAIPRLAPRLIEFDPWYC